MLTHQKHPSTGEMVGEILPADLVAPAATPHRTTWARQQMLSFKPFNLQKIPESHRITIDGRTKMATKST
jgi:hypothetical protein